MAKIVGYRITSLTGDDDKDRGNSVWARMVHKGDTIFDHPEWHHGLVFHNGDINTWAPIVRKPFDTADAADATFTIGMSEDDGDWISSFWVTAILEDGTEHTILSKTPFVKFRSGAGDAFDFRMMTNRRQEKGPRAANPAHGKGQ
jgi:hypothetical protein